MFRHLRTKLTVLYAGLFGITLILVSVAVYAALSRAAERAVRQELEASGAVFDRLWAMRSRRLSDGADLLSRDFGFREAVATGDTPTVQSALENLRRRFGLDLAMMVGVDGRIVVSDGRSLGAGGQAITDAVEMQDRAAGVVLIGGAPYQAISAPVLSPTLNGWVVFASRLDGREMHALERLSAIPLEAEVLGRSESGWTTAAPLASAERVALARFVDRALADHLAVGELDGAGGRAVAVAKPLAAMGEGPPAVLLLRYPLAKALRPYRGLLAAIAAAGLGGAVLMAFASWALARSVTRPVSALDDAVRRLQRGEAAIVRVNTRDEIGRLATSFNAMAAEIGERERRITQLALQDAESGLANRLSLERRLAAMEGQGGVVVAAVGIDRFAHMRGAIGYALAADLVREVGLRLSRAMPEGHIARLSSDVLGVVFHAPDRQAARAAAGALVAALSSPVRLPGATVDVMLTVGLAETAGAGGPRSPIERANIAVEQARAARAGIAFFDAAAYGDPASNLSLMSEMLQGIASNELALHHQPKYDVRRSRVTAVEALVRWRHPRLGFLSPERFIPLAEDTGHIRALTEWVLIQAIDHQAQMRRAGRSLDVSINISGRLLGDGDFADFALGMAERAQGRIRFEITETAMIDHPEKSLGMIDRFAAAGYGIAIDDYGAGLSSLSYLKQIAADELKIDKAFILSLCDSRKDALLVRSTIELAHSLGLTVTAEGVETDAAFALLAGMGCDLAQGFLIAPAMPIDGLLTFLRDGAARRFG